jgi:hypothetical protein
MNKEIIVIIFLLLTLIGLILLTDPIEHLKDLAEPEPFTTEEDFELKEYWIEGSSVCKDFFVSTRNGERLATMCFSENGIIEYGTAHLTDSLYTLEVLPVRKGLIEHGIKIGVVKKYDWWAF